jgi:enoyl-[acyl-carrier-protein] reductase (NADH)
MPETEKIDVVFGLTMGITREQFQGFVEGMTHRRRSTTVAEVAETAAFLASDRGSGFTGTVANLTGGLIVD